MKAVYEISSLANADMLCLAITNVPQVIRDRVSIEVRCYGRIGTVQVISRSTTYLESNKSFRTDPFLLQKGIVYYVISLASAESSNFHNGSGTRLSRMNDTCPVGDSADRS